MQKKLLVAAGLLLTASGFCGEDPFPAFSDLKEPVLIKKNESIKVNEDGTFDLKDSKRYLIGTHYYSGMKMGYGPTSGYPDSLKWLYEQPLTFEDSQRVGFDTIGSTIPDSWTKKHLPGIRTSFWFPQEVKAVKELFKNVGYQLYVDFTCAPWNQGVLGRKENVKKQSADLFNYETFNRTGNHWTPYSMTNPKGRELYVDMWKHGANFVLDSGNKPYFYELFNEPAYNDWSPSSRKLFVERMTEKFGTLENLNKEWNTQYKSLEEIGNFKRQTENPALFVEWCKFMEDVFVETCELGVKTIKEVDSNPDLLFGVQPMAFRVIPKYNVNVYKLSKILNAMNTRTGGGNFFQIMAIKALADGKPIVDGETYIGNTKESIRNSLWTQFARGVNASYIFKWDKRAWDKSWGKSKSAENGKLVAEKFQYLVLNPYAVPTKALTGIMEAKKEILAVSDLFAPRDRGVKAEVGVMLSFPTERLSQVMGTPQHNYIMDYAKSLLYTHFPMEVVYEEQIAEGRTDYKAIVAAGIDSVYADTSGYLEKYVNEGGTLVLGLEAMQLDEYSQPREGNTFPGLLPGARLPQQPSSLEINGDKVEAVPYKKVNVDESWKVLACTGDLPTVFEKKHGKGRVVYINTLTSPEALGELLKTILKNDEVTPSSQTIDVATNKPAFNIEIYEAVNDDYSGFVLFNDSLVPQVVKFVPQTKDQQAWCNPFSKEITTGEICLYLPPQDRVVVVGGDADDLVERFGEMKTVDFKTAKAAALEKLASYQHKKKCDGESDYEVDMSNIKTIDLRNHANRGFIDQVPGDGKGGWTDQGENSLYGMDWGMKTLAGVPFNIIRFDHNENKTCIVLGSQKMPDVPTEVKGIPVSSKAQSLYFLHTTAWTSSEVGFKYVVNYADGTSKDIPITGRVHVEDWWYMKNKTTLEAKVAWRNAAGRGLFAYKWDNPHEEKNIVSIDVISFNGNTIPIVVAITAELPSKAEKIVDLENPNFNIFPWKEIEVTNRDNELLLDLTEKSQDWCGVKIELHKPVDITGKKNLIFDVNGRENIWKKHGGRQGVQVTIGGIDSKGQKVKSAKHINIRTYISNGYIDEDKDTYQKVSLPLDRLIAERDLVKLQDIVIQMKMLRSERCGIAVKNIRID